MARMWPQDGAQWFADAVVDSVGVFCGLIGSLVLIFLLIRRLKLVGGSHVAPRVAIALGLYAIGLMTMFCCSALYNMYVDHPARDLLRRLDHAGIFAMIAGTYSPLALLAIRGSRGLKVFAAMWAAANIGAALKLLVPHSFEQLSLVAYVALGWALLVVRRPLFAAIATPGLILLIGGCVLYSIGVGVFLWNTLPYQVAIWHGLVIAGAACHYACIVGWVAGPTALKQALSS
jgi:hemolysin III